jgi:hypothetical protein
MINEDVFIALLVMVVGALVIIGLMLAGIRDVLADISYELNVRNLAQWLAKVRYVEDSTTEIDS